MGNRERIYLLAIMAMLLLLTMKSLFLDGVNDLNEEEKEFSQYVEQTIESREKWALNKTDVLSYKIVKIKKTDEEAATIIVEDNEKRPMEFSGHYTARVRKYIFWILPYGDFSISMENAQEEE
ncbi:MAG TPA: hypothetical protein VJ990_02230 [Clostridia bacterium]|nr:hypothetical protein [Clostridia bacterium]